MYYYIQIFCIISSANTLSWNIKAHVDLLSTQSVKPALVPTALRGLVQHPGVRADSIRDEFRQLFMGTFASTTANSYYYSTKHTTKYERGTTKRTPEPVTRNETLRKKTDLSTQKDPVQLMKMFSNTLTEYVESLKKRMAESKRNLSKVQWSQHLNNETEKTLHWLNNLGKQINQTFYYDLFKIENRTIGRSRAALRENNFDYIWTRSTKVKQVPAINTFAKDILNRTLESFRDLQNRITEYKWKRYVHRVSKNYEEKFNEFLKDMNKRSLKTNYGAQKAVLNAIDESNRIVNRLFNYIVLKIGEEDVLRSSRSPNILFQEMDKIANWSLDQACSQLHVCRSRNGFIQFIIQYMTNILMAEGKQFDIAFDSLTEAGKFVQIRDSEIETKLQDKIFYIETLDRMSQRARFQIVRNILIKRNQPLVLAEGRDPNEYGIRATIAFLEMANTLDEKVLAHTGNLDEWNVLKQKSYDWATGKESMIQSTMNRFVKHVAEVFNNLDEDSFNIMRNNCRVLFSPY
ncbi:uncharacterized protein LOC142985531 [Anticarsia gemmatalis]|uniref:uncharacterized protein LOC142985531 n=1 Tax=Anticarsia gemmatalis TaxID=129554 RepID=UPI003F77104B